VSDRPRRVRNVTDTDVFGAHLVPGSHLAVIYEQLVAGRQAFISFRTAAEIRFGALRRNLGEHRMRKPGSARPRSCIATLN
jgi:hypothetical protein